MRHSTKFIKRSILLICEVTIMITIAVANQKGGVGKTTIAFNIAQILARRRATRVLAIDNDPQGNLTASFREDPSDVRATIRDAYEDNPLKPVSVSKNLDLLGADISLAPVAERNFEVIYKLKESLDKLQKDQAGTGYDYCIIDCLPSFGHLHLAALTAADYVLIPVKPAPYSLAGMKDLLDTVDKARRYLHSGIQILGIIINHVDGRNIVMEREMEEVLRETYGNLVFKTKIAKRIKLEESPAFQQAITEYDPKGPAAAEFKALVTEMLARITKVKQ